MSNEKLLRLSNGEKHFYQWDTGRRLVVNDEWCSYVHYSNDETEQALTCEIYDREGLRVADVPNILLQTAKPLKVHLSVHDGNGMLTTYTEVFQVVPRKKPEDYMYTETEVLSYIALDERIKAIEENEVSPEAIAEAVNKYMDENPIEETDPTVPEWAKAQSKPTYTAYEVGALPVGTKIPVVPTTVSAFTNDKGYITEQALNGYAKKSDIPSLDGYAKTEDTYTKTELDTIMGAYITDIDNLLGGDA